MIRSILAYLAFAAAILALGMLAVAIMASSGVA